MIDFLASRIQGTTGGIEPWSSMAELPVGALGDPQQSLTIAAQILT